MSESELEGDSRLSEWRPVSRREFLKMAGAAGAAITLAGGVGGLLAGCGNATTATSATGGATTSGASETTAGSATTVTTGGAAKYIVIGDIETMSGPASTDLKRTQWGANDAVDWYNAKGGIKINGESYLLKIENADNLLTVEGATNAANDLVFSKKVQFMLGSYPPFIKQAIYAICAANNVLYAAPWHCSTDPELNKDTPLQFITLPDTLTGLKMTLDWVKQKFPEDKKFSFICVDDGQIEYVDPAVKEYAASTGFEMLGDTIPYAHGTVDFSPLSQQAIMRNPDFIMTGNGGNDLLCNVLKTAREQGFTKLFTWAVFATPADLLKIAGTAAADNCCGIGYDENTPDMTPLMKELIDPMMKRTGFFDNYWYIGFDQVHQLAQVIEKAQSLKTEDVAAAWESMDKINSVMGEAWVRGKNTYGLNHVTVCSTPRGHFDKGVWVHDAWLAPDLNT
jgi:branched-chain amino acid transport system substrate-binding protein